MHSYQNEINESAYALSFPLKIKLGVLCSLLKIHCNEFYLLTGV